MPQTRAFLKELDTRKHEHGEMCKEMVDEMKYDEAARHRGIETAYGFIIDAIEERRES